jgi:hypothetical protein
MMTIRYGRFLAWLLALCLLLPVVPGEVVSVAQADSATYGMTTANGVRVRKEASTKSDYWFQLDSGYICTIEGETNNEGIHWYKVIAVHPIPESTRTYKGYIHGDFFRRLTDQEETDYLSGQAAAAAFESQTAVPTAADADNTSVTAATGTVTNGGTNFREGASMSAHSIMKLDRGTVVQITSVPPEVDENHWYGVYYAGYSGFIRSDFIRLNNSSATVTVSPTATPSSAPTSSGSSSTAYNAVQLILTSCHLRTAPAGSFDTDKDWVGKGSILPLAGSGVNKSGYVWYPVRKDNKTYYVRNDCVQLIYSSSYPTLNPSTVTATPAPTQSTVTPTPAPTAAPTAAPTSAAIFGYVRTIKGGANLRSTIGGTVIRQVAKYRTLPYLLPPFQKSGYTWYFVEVDGNRGYLRSDVVKVVDSPDGEPVVTVAPSPGVTEDPDAAGYVITIASSVNLRTGAGYTPTKGRVDKGVTMPYYGTPTVVKSVTWYHVKHPTLGYGYIHGSYVNIVSPDGSATPTPTGGTVTATPAPTSQVEATYTILQLGSTGAAVQRLVAELKKQGYYTGEVISRYTTAVRNAVRAFQKAKGISVDGIAGAATQHALFGTVPVGAADSSNLTMTLYAAEKIDWWTGGINELWAKGANYKVYDVKTGIVWWAHRWSGGYHVDAEPLTAADTARLCKSYGVTTAQEIANKNLYQRRPLLVTIGTRTFACSLYGVPHNYPEGDTISTNEFRGQLCIHFTNSWTHGSKRVDSLHTEAIQYAWENAPNGHK